MTVVTNVLILNSSNLTILCLQNLESNLKCQFPDHHFCVQPKQPVYLSGDAVELEIPEIEGWHINSSIDPTKVISL